MGNTTTTNSSQKSINDLVTSTISDAASSASVTTRTACSNSQVSIGNTGGKCNQKSVCRDQVTYVTDITALTSTTNINNMIATIMTTLSATTDVKNNGNFSSDTATNVYNEVENILTQNITANTITSVFAGNDTTSSSNQACINNTNTGTKQGFFSSMRVMTDSVAKGVNSNYNLQKMSADLSNILSASTSVKNTGIIGIIVRCIMIVIVAVVLIACVVGGIILIGMIRL
jgi:hypothetical protein